MKQTLARQCAVMTAAASSALCVLGCAQSAPGLRVDLRGPAYDGGEVRFNGVYYDFRAANGIQMIKMWVPPGDEPIRGALFHGNPGGYGDTRNIPRDERLQEFAARHRFAIIGVTSFPGRQVYPDLAEVIVRAMEDWAALGRHPEVAYLPLIARGSSNAGVTAYSLACYVPERMICFTPNVGPRYNPSSPPDAALKVPAIMHVGPTDPFFRNGMDSTRELFADARPRGALWAWTAEQGKGHEIRHIDDVDMQFYETCIALRLPPDADPRSGPVQLADIPEEAGWLADPESWESGITTIAPYAEYEGDRSVACWLPSADIAFLYRGIATYDNPIELSARDLGPVDNPYAAGVMLRSVGGRLVDPGSKVVLECDMAGLPDWQSVTFCRGAHELATVSRADVGDGKPSIEVIVEPERTVYAFTALARDANGNQRTSFPMHFLVRDPGLEPALAEQRAAAAWVPGPRPRPAYGSSAIPCEAEFSDQVLVAYGLSAAQERQLAADGKLSPFWQEFGPEHSRVVLTVADHFAVQGEGEGQVTPEGGARVTVLAARSRAGLHLLFDVEDDEFAPAQGLADSLDFHLCRLSSAQLWAAPPEDVFVKPESWAFALAADQFQLNMAGATHVFRNFPDPWDVHRWEDELPAAQSKYGVRVSFHDIAPGRRAVEWLIPWDYVGNGGPMDEPATGAMLGLALGYNDRDPQRHGPDEFDRLRWPNRIDPWWQPGQKGPDPASPWGDLQMGPPLTP